jgi:hypothetical protein
MWSLLPHRSMLRLSSRQIRQPASSCFRIIMHRLQRGLLFRRSRRRLQCSLPSLRIESFLEGRGDSVLLLVRSFPGTCHCRRHNFSYLFIIMCFNPSIYATFVQTNVSFVLLYSPLNSMSDPGTPSVENCTCLSGYVQSEPGAICYNPGSGHSSATPLRLCSQYPTLRASYPFHVLPPLHLCIGELALAYAPVHTDMIHWYIHAPSLLHARTYVRQIVRRAHTRLENRRKMRASARPVTRENSQMLRVPRPLRHAWHVPWEPFPTESVLLHAWNVLQEPAALCLA